jgi:hypothetical protein
MSTTRTIDLGHIEGSLFPFIVLIPAHYEYGSSVTDEVADWLREHVSPRGCQLARLTMTKVKAKMFRQKNPLSGSYLNTDSATYFAAFENELDAIAFKLRFSGT